MMSYHLPQVLDIIMWRWNIIWQASSFSRFYLCVSFILYILLFPFFENIPQQMKEHSLRLRNKIAKLSVHVSSMQSVIKKWKEQGAVSNEQRTGCSSDR